MKKLLSIILASSFLTVSAFAGGMIGVKVGTGELDGKRTVDPSHGVATKASGSANSEFAAIFGEIELSNMISIGLEYVPLEAKIDTKATTTTDSTAIIKDFKTIYAMVSFGDLPVYAKLGYGHADLSVKANYDTVTILSNSDSLEGLMAGVGVQFESPLPLLDVLRIEANYYDFDELSIRTSNTNGTADTHTKKGEAELLTLGLSIAKSF